MQVKIINVKDDLNVLLVAHLQRVKLPEVTTKTLLKSNKKENTFATKFPSLS